MHLKSKILFFFLFFVYLFFFLQLNIFLIICSKVSRNDQKFCKTNSQNSSDFLSQNFSTDKSLKFSESNQLLTTISISLNFIQINPNFSLNRLYLLNFFSTNFKLISKTFIFSQILFTNFWAQCFFFAKKLR